MLTDTALKQLKSKDKPYKVADRDGMYIHIATSGFTTFRYDYRYHARQDVFDYIEMFYNLKHKHANNGLLSPVEFERQQK